MISVQNVNRIIVVGTFTSADVAARSRDRVALGIRGKPQLNFPASNYTAGEVMAALGRVQTKHPTWVTATVLAKVCPVFRYTNGYCIHLVAGTLSAFVRNLIGMGKRFSVCIHDGDCSWQRACLKHVAAQSCLLIAI